MPHPLSTSSADDRDGSEQQYLDNNHSPLSTLSHQSSQGQCINNLDSSIECSWSEGNDNGYVGAIVVDDERRGQEESTQVDVNNTTTAGDNVDINVNVPLNRSRTPPPSSCSMIRSRSKESTDSSHYKRCAPTPKAGNGNITSSAITTKHRNGDSSYQQQPNTNRKKQDGEYSSNNKKKENTTGVWDIVYSTLGLPKRESIDYDTKSKGRKEACRGGDVEQPPPSSSIPESQENDMFAMDVGLVYDGDEDTINDPSILLHSLTTLSESKSFLESFPIENVTSPGNASHAYDLSKYLKYHKDSKQLPQLTHNSHSNDNGQEVCALPNEDESTTSASVRDDYGNLVPENYKMAMGYDDARRRKTTRTGDDTAAIGVVASAAATTFPTLQSAGTSIPSEEMEKRLRELGVGLGFTTSENTMTPPALARRLRDFQFAREKRRMKYGNAKLWGILGLYDHLSGVKLDVEWAEDAAYRRKHKEPYLKWADYEAIKNEGFNRPFFTYLIVTACTAMMFTSIYLNDWSFEPISVNPMIGPSAETLLRLGAKDSYLIVTQQEIWRLASPMVLHAGLIHYVLNMLALWFVGKAVEQIHGLYPAFVLFIVPAVGGTILSAIFLPGFITVGASGGIFGLIGGCVADIFMNWGILFNKFVNERGARLSHAKVLIILFFDIVLNCLIGLTPFVDNFTHLGGMIYGLLCGMSTIQMVSPRFFGDERTRSHNAKLFCFRSVGLLTCLAGMIASSVILFSGDGETNPCTSCTYMSCMTFPPWNEKDDKWWYCDDCAMATAEGTYDTSIGKFVGDLNLNCPSGVNMNVSLDESWPQQEAGLEEMLPTLCREYC